MRPMSQAKFAARHVTAKCVYLFGYLWFIPTRLPCLQCENMLRAAMLWGITIYHHWDICMSCHPLPSHWSAPQFFTRPDPMRRQFGKGKQHRHLTATSHQKGTTPIWCMESAVPLAQSFCSAPPFLLEPEHWQRQMKTTFFHVPPTVLKIHKTCPKQNNTSHTKIAIFNRYFSATLSIECWMYYSFFLSLPSQQRFQLDLKVVRVSHLRRFRRFRRHHLRCQRHRWTSWRRLFSHRPPRWACWVALSIQLKNMRKSNWIISTKRDEH